MDSSKLWFAFFAIILGIFSGIISNKIFNQIANHEKQLDVKIQELKEIEQKIESYYEDLFKKIVQCESSGKILAINPRDKDGTASFGILQWKPETFKEYGVKYGVIGEKASWDLIMTKIFDYQTNKYLFIQIIKNEPEKIKKLWPNCSKKL